MHFANIAAAYLSIAGCALAIPLQQAEAPGIPNLVPRASYTITFWKDISWSGENIRLENQETSQCKNMPSGWNDKASSVKVSAGHSCRYWKDGNCQGSVFGGTEQDYVSFPSGFNDQITSWRCS